MASKIVIQPKYNKWTVLEEVEKTTARNFLCKCDCGNTSIVRIDQLTKGKSTGCRNCANKHKEHGEYKTRLYRIWMGMVNRCNLKPDYSSISVTEEWRRYLPFRDWSISNGYEETLTLDRKDVYVSGMSLKDIGKKYSYIYKINEELFIEGLLKRVDCFIS